MTRVLQACVCMIVLVGTVAAQQTAPTGLTAAPVPPQIRVAKKVFISNVPGELSYYTNIAEDDPYRTYNEFYASLKSWGYYELVSTPAEADLILEISLSNRPMMSDALHQQPVHQAHLVLVVRDPRTQVALWWLAERVQQANRPATGEKNYSQAMTNLVNDVRKLAGQTIPPAGETKK